jgi:hypothetical protein
MEIQNISAFTISHNLIYGTSSTTGINNISGNPRFVSPTENFNLQSNSPAINRGTNVGLTKDFDGKKITGTPEIGAYEF